MNSAVIQLLVLAGIAIFLILRLRSVLGTREGYEKPRTSVSGPADARSSARRDFEVIEGGVDRDITDHVEEGSDAAKALAAMKLTDPSFQVSDFLHGARGAYEMILMAFESGQLDEVKDFLGEDVFQTFVDVVAAREDQGVQVEANFVGIREISLQDSTFDRATNTGEVTVKFVGELTSVVRNSEGEIIEGDPNQIKRQRDVWTFSRQMTGNDPNWVLIATGE
ncbi:MAG: Tim44/TimA family putative adaptor protein [Pseudomonadota bacterium]